MAKYRQAARVDDNQAEIVKELRKMGLSVQLGMDDILVGYRGRTYWFEIKDPAKTLKKDGAYKKGALKDSQIQLTETWKGHYQVVHSLDQILKAVKGG